VLLLLRAVSDSSSTLSLTRKIPQQRKEAEEEGADPDRAMSLIELQYVERGSW